MKQQLNDEELEFVARASRYLEHPSFLIGAAAKLGRPIEAAVDMLPAPARTAVTSATHKAMDAALDVAIRSLGDTSGTAALDFREAEAASHKRSKETNALTALTGGASGFLGGWTIGVELPVSTTLMLRSIAESARLFGEDLSDTQVRLDCLSVFAFGGSSRQDDAAESAYYTARIGLAKLITEAAVHLGGKTSTEITKLIGKRAAPALVQLLSRIAQRFEIVVSQKFVAQAVPVLGAVGGAALNVLFTDHFNKVATYHFGLKALERKYGTAVVQQEYASTMKVIEVAPT